MMRVRRWLIFTALVASLVARTAVAEEYEAKYHEKKGELQRFYVTPFVGWMMFDRERQFTTGGDLPDDWYFGGRAGVRLTHLLGLDFAGGYVPVTKCDCDWVDWSHFSGNLMLSPAPHSALDPFLSLGGGWSAYKHSVGKAEKLGTFEVAGGLRLKLTETFGLRLEARNILAIPKAPLKSAHIDDVVLGAGLNIAFGGDDEQPEVAVACPDSDHDGVCDAVDQCPNTLSGCQVDSRGCPIDSDGDGVCDGLDQCPNTVVGAVVDRVGCVVAAEVKPEVEPEVKQREQELLDTGMLRISDINFDFDKSDIRSGSYHTLDVVGKVLTKWPGLRIEIDGHTDSRGRDKYNLDLSHRRAESVRAYLLAHFPQFTPDQLTAKGFGESAPIVPNDSEEHMATNRRVEFKVLNRELLQRDK